MNSEPLPCRICSAPVPRQASTGQRPKYCSPACRRVKAKSYPHMRRTCSKAGCSSREYDRGLCQQHHSQATKAERGICRIHRCAAFQSSDGLCEKHLRLGRELGTDGRRVTATETSNGYRLIYSPDHPITRAGGMVLEHRVVLFEKLGPGTQVCHWCETPVSWTSRARKADALIVDHLDDDRGNNAPENLVPSCNTCNVSRGYFQAWIRKRAGDSPERVRWLCEQLIIGATPKS